MQVATPFRHRIGQWLVQGFLCFVVGLPAFVSDAQAATSSNASSPLGINLNSVNYYSSELPFLNVFKMGSGWITHSNSTWDTSEEKYLNLDSNGYPITLSTVNDPNPQQFTMVGALLLNGLPSTPNGYYPGGQYAVDYDGQGTLSYQFDATLVSSSPGRDVVKVTPSAAGIFVLITSTDPNHTGNYIRNIRVVPVGSEAALNGGQIFNPAFLSNLQRFRVLRFMDWLGTNNSTLSSWSSRPQTTNAFWGTANGVPLEVAIQLANAVSADAWLNIPVKADNNYITQMATLVQGQLGTSQKAYVEFSNEVWNGGFSQNAYAVAQGQAVFPSQSNKTMAGWEWYGMRVAGIADIWYGVYGASGFSSRVVIVMAGQAANAAVLQEELSTPDWTGTGNGPAAAHHIGAAAIAPYFVFTPSSATVSSWLSQSDGGLSALFAYASSSIATSNSWTSSTVAAISSYGIPVVAYEGGQSLQGFPTYGSGSAAVNLFIAANRDARMATAYTNYFNGWKASRGTLFMDFSDSGAYSQYGEWGALESMMQTTSPLASAPPKWQALQNFISNTPCWWSGCSGSTSSPPPPAVPMPPTNLSVH